MHMPIFGSTRTTSTTRRRKPLFRRDKDRVAGGYRAALANPNTTRTGRKDAKIKLRMMGQSSHVPLLTKIRRTLGIRKTPRRQRQRQHIVNRNRRRAIYVPRS